MKRTPHPRQAMIVKTGDPREHLNLVFIGRVDAGKSTSGSILCLTVMLTNERLNGTKKEAKNGIRESLVPAFIMDITRKNVPRVRQ
jgi:peptide chain release factor subunit 3